MLAAISIPSHRNSHMAALRWYSASVAAFHKHRIQTNDGHSLNVAYARQTGRKSGIGPVRVVQKVFQVQMAGPQA